MTQLINSENATKKRGRPFEVGHPGGPGRPKKGNAIRDLLKSVPIAKKRELVKVAYDAAVNGDYHWAEWIAKHSGESGSGEQAGREGVLREIIVREYGFDPGGLD